jgi:hypothetical protein
VSSNAIRRDGWYEAVPLGRVEWYNDSAPTADPGPEPPAIERRPEPPSQPTGHDTHTTPRLPQRGKAAGILALLWILGLAVMAGAYAYSQSASPLAALADVGLGLTVGWITVDLAKAYRRRPRRRY